MNDQAESLRNRFYQKQAMFSSSSLFGVRKDAKCRVIAVTSGKGGVGKTNLTVNLALALAERNCRVLIIDADLGMANVDVLMGASSPHHLLHLLENDVSLKDVIAQGPGGIQYLSGGSGIEKLANLRYDEFERIVQKLSQCEGLADIILIDTGAGLGKNVLNFLLAADEVILLTTPEPTAMTDAYAIMKAYGLYAETPCMRLVVNRIFDDGEGAEVCTKLLRTAERFLQLDVIPLGEIYEDRNMMKSVKAQRPLLLMYPDTLASRCIKAIAENLLEGKYVVASRGFQAFLDRFLKFLS